MPFQRHLAATLSGPAVTCAPPPAAPAAGNWSPGYVNAYEATYVLCFICVGVYCCMFAGLVLLKPWVQAGGEADELGMTSLRARGPMSHDLAGAAGAAGAPAGMPSEELNSVEAAQKSASGAWQP